MTDAETIVLQGEGVQFDRFIEVTIKNFITKEQHVISNDFNITFEFLKSIDEIAQASTGSMQITGLSRETFNKIKSEGGEIQVDCGYKYNEISTLFFAVITRMWQDSGNGTLTTNIEFSANVLNYSFYGQEELSAVSMINVSPNKIFYKVAKASNAIPIVDAFTVPLNKQDQFYEFIKTASFSVYVQGEDLRETLKNIVKDLGFTMTTSKSKDGELEYLFTITNEGWSNMQQKINNGYQKISKVDKSKSAVNATLKEDNKLKQEAVKFINLFETSESLTKKAVVLGYKTGLKSFEPEYRIATVLETKELAKNEKYTQSAIDSMNKAEEARVKRIEKEANRLAKGLKPLKTKVEKIKEVKVNREYMRVKALLNPQVKPQSHIMLLQKQGYSIYRVRNVKYMASNRDGVFDMDLYCEDSAGKYDTLASTQDINTREVVVQNDPENISNANINQSLGNNTSYGETLE